MRRDQAGLGLLVPRWPGRRGAGVSAAGLLVSVVAGSARYASRWWRAERALGPGEGREGVRGNRGNRALGGFPGSPGSLQVSSSGRCGAVCAACAVQFPRSLVRRAGLSGEAGMGVWGKTWNRAVFSGPGGFRVFPQCVSGLVSPVVCSLV